MTIDDRTAIDETVGRLVDEESSWPGVTAGDHRFGGAEWRIGPREIGHVHAGGCSTSRTAGRFATP